MDSSTSPSSNCGRIPRLAGCLLLLGVVTWAVGAWFILAVHPEMRFASAAAQRKLDYARKLTSEKGVKSVIYGGSSCAFSINGQELLEKYGLPVANLGMMAGLGARINTLFALQAVQRGDNLLIALEPSLLTDPIEPVGLEMQFSLRTGHPEWMLKPQLGQPGVSLLSAGLLVRPGGYQLLTLAGKILMRQPLYRYRIEEVQASGWQQTPVKMEISGPPGHRIHLSDDAKRFLQALAAQCRERGVRLAYVLPWGYCPPEEVAAFRRENAEFLLEVSQWVEVLKDPMLGAYAVREEFADTSWHLNGPGSARRCEVLATQIKSWQSWTREELKALSASTAYLVPEVPWKEASSRAMASTSSRGDGSPGLAK